MSTQSTPQINLDDYSPSSTITPFPTPLPLLRVPIQHDPTSPSPPFLAFSSPRAFFTTHNTTQSKLTQQCKTGARVGCSIAALDSCKPSWWERILGRKGLSLGEKQRCEELAMKECVALAEERCVVFAKDKCVGPFKDARVVVGRREGAEEMIGWVSLAGRSRGVDLVGGVRVMQVWCSTKCLSEDGILKGSELLGLEQRDEVRR